MEVFIIAAQTVDGFIARFENDRSFDWTSSEDKQFYVEQLKKSDAIVMGRKSFATFSRYPKDSRWIIYTSNPAEFQNPSPSVIKAEATKEGAEELIFRLEKEGCQRVAICGGSSIYSMFMKAGVVDKLFLTTEPVIFGDGVSLFKQKIDAKLKLVATHQLSEQTQVNEYLVTSK